MILKITLIHITIVEIITDNYVIEKMLHQNIFFLDFNIFLVIKVF